MHELIPDVYEALHEIGKEQFSYKKLWVASRLNSAGWLHISKQNNYCWYILWNPATSSTGYSKQKDENATYGVCLLHTNSWSFTMLLDTWKLIILSSTTITKPCTHVSLFLLLFFSLGSSPEETYDKKTDNNDEIKTDVMTWFKRLMADFNDLHKLKKLLAAWTMAWLCHKIKIFK